MMNKTQNDSFNFFQEKKPSTQKIYSNMIEMRKNTNFFRLREK